ncbi:MAG: hypothetical protein ABI949_10625 [Ilumatobacteraceae bacterium]
MKRVRRCLQRGLLVALIVAVAGCSSNPRDDARHSLVKQLEGRGLDGPTAECVVTAFFDGKSNDELQGFFDRPDLTPEEATEFAELGKQCATQS